MRAIAKYGAAIVVVAGIGLAPLAMAQRSGAGTGAGPGAPGPIAASGTPSGPTGARDMTGPIREQAGMIGRHLELLQSPDQATRIAAFSALAGSGDAGLFELAVETGLASTDRTLQALAVRAGFKQVRSIVAKLAVPESRTNEARAVLEVCGDAVSYKIEGYTPATGAFVVHGQDSTGVGNVSGTTISLTIDYGCSLTGILQADGMFAGFVSAPYKKGSLPARFAFR